MMTIFDLTGHVALVTGGNGGLGLAMAKGLAKCNARVAIWGRNKEKIAHSLRELKEIDTDVEGFECDVTNSDDVARTFAKTVDRFGKIDSCFANAGGGGVSGSFHQLSDQDWAGNVDLNLNSVAYTFKPMISHLLSRGAPGKLVVTSSAAAILGTPNNVAYSTTKAAVVGMARALAVELGRANIQVNALLPGFIETDMSLDTPQFFQDACKRRAVSGKAGELDDMEGIAVYLASDRSNFMTGQAIVLDGGHSINSL